MLAAATMVAALGIGGVFLYQSRDRDFDPEIWKKSGADGARFRMIASLKRKIDAAPHEFDPDGLIAHLGLPDSGMIRNDPMGSSGVYYLGPKWVGMGPLSLTRYSLQIKFSPAGKISYFSVAPE